MGYLLICEIVEILGELIDNSVRIGLIVCKIAIYRDCGRDNLCI